MYSMSPYSGELLSDEEVIAKFKNEKQWGLEVSIDLGQCDHDKISDGDYICQFAKDLVDEIKMKPPKQPPC